MDFLWPIAKELALLHNVLSEENTPIPFKGKTELHIKYIERNLNIPIMKKILEVHKERIADCLTLVSQYR